MNILFWLLIGLAAGAIAKSLTPQKERSGWISSILIGIVGSMVGGFIASATGLAPVGSERNLITSLLIATGGAFLVLFLYHRFTAGRTNTNVNRPL